MRSLSPADAPLPRLESAGLPFIPVSEAEKFEPQSFYTELLHRPPLISSDKIRGMFLGIVIGDALGMPVELFSCSRIAECYGRISDYLPPLMHKGFSDCPAGTWTDDTQLSIALADAIDGRGPIAMDAVVRTHLQALRECTRGWGSSTRNSLERLSSGISWSECGKSDKPRAGTGNGVVMKVGPLGAYAAIAGRPEDELLDTIASIAKMTHHTSLAVSSAIVHSFGIAYCLASTPDSFSPEAFAALASHYGSSGDRYLPKTPDSEQLKARLDRLGESRRSSTEDIIAGFGAGSCCASDSLPFSYMFYLRNPHSLESLFDAINAGGDTDSNGSLVGSLLGALHGTGIFPRHLVEGVHNPGPVFAAADRLCRVLGARE